MTYRSTVTCDARSNDLTITLENFCELHDQFAPIFQYMGPEHVAWLIYKLKYVQDTPDIFPKGKWGTIQRLQDMVDDYAR